VENIGANFCERLIEANCALVNQKIQLIVEIVIFSRNRMNENLAYQSSVKVNMRRKPFNS